MKRYGRETGSRNALLCLHFHVGMAYVLTVLTSKVSFFRKKSRLIFEKAFSEGRARMTKIFEYDIRIQDLCFHKLLQLYEFTLWTTYRNPCDMFPSRIAYTIYGIAEMYCLMHMLSLQFVISIERTVATIYVDTYESCRRTFAIFFVTATVRYLVLKSRNLSDSLNSIMEIRENLFPFNHGIRKTVESFFT
ncbi:unnamed protein product [Haemonchus placei]|uniref:Gustatory receptor n=1 Tax=Haemonchus placei TaxID=6290 RepID=A0A0N4W510_HAEPC|nr:unnamed protein product [Haemonchus placei]